MSDFVDSNGFWEALSNKTDPAAYKPQRNPQVIAQQLVTENEIYFVLKQPQAKNYLRLSNVDFALWRRMDGRKTIKDLLYYSLLHYKMLPIGRLNRLTDDLRNGGFFLETPTNMYAQVAEQLETRSQASRGRRILQGVLHSERSLDGLDGFFSGLYRWCRWLFTPVMQLLLLILVLFGGVSFGRLVWLKEYSLVTHGLWSLVTLIVGNLLIIGIHELAHGLTVKHFGRELNRGGFLIYWGMPAFFVDTRDMWLSSNRQRIWVSWAGPYSGLIIGALVGILLTAVVFPEALGTFIYQIGFLAYLSVIINLNPLLELDGYFMLMDWLDMPNLRERAFRFWRVDIWSKVRTNWRFWTDFDQQDRILTIYGALAFIYSIVALFLAFYFWRSRLEPLVTNIWQRGIWGKWLLLFVTAALTIPLSYYILHYLWDRLQAATEWLARRDMLARPGTLALLLGLPVLIGLPLIYVLVATLPSSELWQGLLEWFVLLATMATLITIARQLPGSRFQWVFWALVVAVIGLAIVVVGPPVSSAGDFALLFTGLAVLAAGLIAWFTVRPHPLHAGDIIFITAVALLGLLTGALLAIFNRLEPIVTVLLILTTLSLMAFVPLLLNFRRTRFLLPWLLILVAIATLPLLSIAPEFEPLVLLIWLYGILLYAVAGRLAQFTRQMIAAKHVGLFGERQRLINSFHDFLGAMFDSYEAIFGYRRLAALRRELSEQPALKPTVPIAKIRKRCTAELLLVIDRLDDLAGTPFTHAAGQAAYDSLPWLEAETLGRYVLADMQWGADLARGFITARDQNLQLIRQTDIFAGFDHQGAHDLLATAVPRTFRRRTIAYQDAEAEQFYLLVSGTVGVYRENGREAEIDSGGYFGTNALLDHGPYSATYRAQTSVTALVINRKDFDPLWRADTTLASQVQVSAAERKLLHQMPLFSGLSPQQLTAVDNRLAHRSYTAGESIVQQGEQRSYFFIVASGRVDVLITDQQGERQVGSLGRGEHFGEYALFADVTYLATYRAATAVDLLLLDEPTFDRLAAECERLSHYAEQIGTGRLISTRRHLGPGAILA